MSGGFGYEERSFLYEKPSFGKGNVKPEQSVRGCSGFYMLVLEEWSQRERKLKVSFAESVLGEQIWAAAVRPDAILSVVNG